MTSKKDQQQYWVRREPYRFIPSKEFAEAFQSFHVGRKLAQELGAPFDKSKSHPAALTTNKYGVSKKEFFKACMDREWLLMKRNSFVYIFKLFQVCFCYMLYTVKFSWTHCQCQHIIRKTRGAYFISQEDIIPKPYGNGKDSNDL